MFKKINRYFLFNYPLLWNMRIVQVAIFAFVLNGLFFVMGYYSVRNLYVFADNSGFRQSEIQTFLLAGLLLLLGLIYWLSHYLRNNAFKSFYPLRPRALRMEFLLLFLMFFCTITVFHFYRYGRHLKLLKVSEHLNPLEDIPVVNQASVFLPYSTDSYDKEYCCDSLQARAERQLQYPDKNNNACHEGGVEETLTEITESVPADEPLKAVREYSYLYYCHLAVQYPQPGGRDEYHYHNTARRWLKNGQKDSVKQVLQAYFRIMDTYGMRYKVHADTLANWCFADSAFSVNHVLNNIYDRYTPFSLSDYQGEFTMLNGALSSILEERQKTFRNISEWLVYVYVALGLAMLLALFRFSRLKPWLIALVGIGIWSILFSLISFLFSTSVEYLFLGMVVLAVLLAAMMIRSGKSKTYSVLWLHWFACTFPFVLPLLFHLIYRATFEEKACINNQWVVTVPEPPIHGWISRNWDLINSANIALIFLVFMFGIISLLYRWQANPHE